MKVVTRTLLVSFLCTSPTHAQFVWEWSHQTGSTGNDNARDVIVAPSGEVAVSGMWNATASSANPGDAYVTRFDHNGQVLWSHQFEFMGGGQSNALGMSLGNSGRVYIGGYSIGAGGPNQGRYRAFASCLDASGLPVWTHLIGSESKDQQVNAVATDAVGNSYFVGETTGDIGGKNSGAQDMFIVKYDDSGTMIWARQFGTLGSDLGLGVALDESGNIYVSGFRGCGGCGGTLWKLDDLGIVQWIASFEDGRYGDAVALDAFSNAYVCGLVFKGSSDYDSFVAKVGLSGTVLWQAQIATPLSDWATSIVIDNDGAPLVTGHTQGSIGGQNLGSADGFLCRYTAAGEHDWSVQFGTQSAEEVWGAAATVAGDVVVAGTTSGSFAGPSAGGSDIFIVRFGKPQCPADCDSSGTLEPSDFMCFIDEFNAGSPNADCDQSGLLDFFDLLCFVNEYFAGCP